MKNFRQAGNIVNVAAPYGIASGEGVLVGGLFGIAATDAANAATVELKLNGVFDIAALTTDTGTIGTKMYWDAANKRLTVTSASNTLVGCLAMAKGGTDTTARILLDGCVRSAAGSSNVAPTITSAPVILGTPTVGTAVAATAGVFTGTPTPTVSRDWLVAGVVVATASTYTPVTADATKVLTVRETATNTAGNVVSNSTGVTIAAAAAPAIPLSAGGLRMVMVAGQSLAIGTINPATNPPPPTQPELPTNFKLFNGVSASGKQSVAITDADTASLIPYVELTGTYGAQGFYTHGTGFFKAIDTVDDPAQNWLWAQAGYGGQKIELLDVNGQYAGVTATAAYANQQKMLARAYALNPNTVVTAILFSQGEANWQDTTPKAYYDKVLTYRANQRAAVQAVFASQDPPFIMEQCGDGNNNVKVQQAQADLARNSTEVVVAGPKYWLNQLYPNSVGTGPNFTDVERVHLNVNGYTYQGEMQERALVAKIAGVAFKPTIVNTVVFVNPTTIKITCSTPNGGGLVVDETTLPACPGKGISMQRPDLNFILPTNVTVSCNDITCVFGETIYPDFRLTIGYTLAGVQPLYNTTGNYTPCTNIRGAIGNASKAGLSMWYDWLMLDRYVMGKTDVGYVKPATYGVELWRLAAANGNVAQASSMTFDGTNVVKIRAGTTESPTPINAFVEGGNSPDVLLWPIKNGRTYLVTVDNCQVTSGSGAHEIRVVVGNVIIKRTSANVNNYNSGNGFQQTVTVSSSTGDGILNVSLNGTIPVVGSISGISVKEVL